MLSGQDAARFLGLPGPELLPPIAMLAGNDTTAHHSLRPLLLRSLGLFDGAHIREIAALFARHHNQQRLQSTLDAFLSAPEHAALGQIWRATEVGWVHGCVHVRMSACVPAPCPRAQHQISTNMQAAYALTAPKEALLPLLPLPDCRQLLDAAAAQGEAAARERLLGRGLPAFVVEAMLKGRLPRRLGLMLSSSAPAAAAVAAEAPALTVAQDKERALKDMLFGFQRQQQQREETGTAWVLRGMAEEERALAARRRTWKAPLLFERMRGSGGSDDGKDRPGAAALTRRLRALLYGLVGMQGSVLEEVLLADDTCVRMCTHTYILWVWTLLTLLTHLSSYRTCLHTGRWWRWHRCQCCSGRPSWTRARAAGKVRPSCLAPMPAG